jgi:hypothetical protein
MNTRMRLGIGVLWYLAFQVATMVTPLQNMVPHGAAR